MNCERCGAPVVLGESGYHWQDWQPIATAPKDGTPFLACKAGGVFQVCRVVQRVVRDGTGAWAKDQVVIFPADLSWNPSHWLPLPPPPRATDGPVQ